MYQLTDFSDSTNIVIDSRNNIAYFHYSGTSYRDKLKNGLSLEEVYEQDQYIGQEQIHICIPNDNIFTPLQKCKPVIRNIENPDYDNNNCYKKYCKKGYKKGNKQYCKKGNKEKRKALKKHIKQNGYLDKLFYIEQNSSDVYMEEEHWLLYIDPDLIKYNAYFHHWDYW
jgi:hypothetical protein